MKESILEINIEKKEKIFSKFSFIFKRSIIRFSLISFILFLLFWIFNEKQIKKKNIFKNSYISLSENKGKENCIDYNEEENKCLKCTNGYKLLNGECIINYSFKAIYKSKVRNENINLFNISNDYILEMIIDDKYVKPSKNYTFFKKGLHTLYVLLNIAKINSLNYMFYEIDNLISISFTEKFNIKHIQNMSYTFSFCSSLTELNFGNINTNNIKDMSYMFSGCSSLSHIDLSKFNTENVINMDSLFLGCSSLTSIDLSNFNTKNTNSMSKMFYDCSSLRYIIHNFNTEKVISMESMFYNCISLTSINISGFNTLNVKKMNYMFYGCSNLKSIDITNFNTENVYDMSFMFVLRMS